MFEFLSFVLESLIHLPQIAIFGALLPKFKGTSFAPPEGKFSPGITCFDIQGVHCFETATRAATTFSLCPSTTTKFCTEMTTGSYSLGLKLHTEISQIADFSTELCGVSVQ